ncbi:hypothetical protein Bache_0547 [Bacteroides helcogenes P 36-108]|uniref:Glycosyl transferase family 11 n=2 Tax=Bacteroides helcogenes TaxID=290053 RepID=E6SW47_BACT6|nr:hypothetical protein Bache_0547 [Bacteroides helcogenes P 36-108]
MCNNILQYAHAYAFGREYGIFVFSMRFSYKYQYFRICRKWYHNFGSYLLAKMCIALRLLKIVSEDTNPQVVAEVRNSGIVVVDQWGFRFPELLLKYRREILDLFDIKSSIKSRVNHWLDQHDGNDGRKLLRLGVHIRRGDYATWQGGKYFFPDATYIDLINQFCRMHDDCKINVYICTNDEKLCLDQYRQEIGHSVYLFRGSGVEDLYLLSQCDYLIGVKSTFSLVAAFYRDIPLYWIMDRDKPFSPDSFRYFKDLFTTV